MSSGPNQPPAPSITIRVVPGNLTLNVGGAGTLTATVADASGVPVPNAAVTWQSRNASVATVNNGNVVAIAVGQTTIVASSGGKSDSASVIVLDNVTLTIAPSAGTVNVGKTLQFNVVARNSASQTVPTPSLSWMSSDPTIAIVSASGIATGVAKGAVTISAAAGTITTSASLTVADSVAATPTPVGTPTGPIVSAVIGSGGGSVASDDGILAVDIPVGALASNVTITLQPVSNTAPGGFSSSYRLGPEGQTFAKPVTLKFTFPSDVIDGADTTSVTIASQQPDGTWLPVSTTRDATTRTLTASTTHFSIWTAISNLWIDPPFAAVNLGNSRSFTANFCGRVGNVVTQCITNVAGTGVNLVWSVNGVVGGSTTLGTVTANGTQATYNAPTTAPPGRRVTLGVTATTAAGARWIANANVQVGPQDSWGGTIEVTAVSNVAGGTLTITSLAQVSFRWNAGQALYTPNGNMTVRYDFVNSARPCATRLTGARSILDADGTLQTTSVSGQTYYLGLGFVSNSFVLTGTTTCNDQLKQEPLTLNQTGYGWWPAQPPANSPMGFLVKSNGTEMQEDIQLQGVNTRVTWLLRRGQ